MHQFPPSKRLNDIRINNTTVPSVSLCKNKRTFNFSFWQHNIITFIYNVKSEEHDKHFGCGTFAIK